MKPLKLNSDRGRGDTAGSAAAKMKRPATIDGRPLIASTKMRTGRRHLLRDSLRKTAAATPERQRPQQRQADLLERADDRVRARRRRSPA